jgi:hypothetical protein
VKRWGCGGCGECCFEAVKRGGARERFGCEYGTKVTSPP